MQAPAKSQALYGFTVFITQTSGFSAFVSASKHFSCTVECLPCSKHSLTAVLTVHVQTLLELRLTAMYTVYLYAPLNANCSQHLRTRSHGSDFLWWNEGWLTSHFDPAESQKLLWCGSSANAFCISVYFSPPKVPLASRGWGYNDIAYVM